MRQPESMPDQGRLYLRTPAPTIPALPLSTKFTKSTNNTCWRGYKEKGILLHYWWECKLVQPLWKTVWKFLRKLKIELPYDPAIPLLGMYLNKTIIQRETHRAPAMAQRDRRHFGSAGMRVRFPSPAQWVKDLLL